MMTMTIMTVLLISMGVSMVVIMVKTIMIKNVMKTVMMVISRGLITIMTANMLIMIIIRTTWK